MYQLWFKSHNCNQKNEETNQLSKCTSKERQKLLYQSMGGLKDCMIDHYTYPELVEWYPSTVPVREWLSSLTLVIRRSDP